MHTHSALYHCRFEIVFLVISYALTKSFDALLADSAHLHLYLCTISLSCPPK
jgi:hypothetical protein